APGASAGKSATPFTEGSGQTRRRNCPTSATCSLGARSATRGVLQHPARSGPTSGALRGDSPFDPDHQLGKFVLGDRAEGDTQIARSQGNDAGVLVIEQMATDLLAGEAELF